MRSHIHPPIKHPAAVIRPLITPVTKATVLAPACQSPATAAHKLEAAAVPMGRKQSARARTPILVFRVYHKSLKRFRSVLVTPFARTVEGYSFTKERTRQQSRQATASAAVINHMSDTCCASQSPAPPPSPAPPRLPACTKPPT